MALPIWIDSKIRLEILCVLHSDVALDMMEVAWLATSVSGCQVSGMSCS